MGSKQKLSSDGFDDIMQLKEEQQQEQQALLEQEFHCRHKEYFVM